MNNKIIIGLVLATVIIIAGAAFLIPNQEKSLEIGTSSDAKVGINQTLHDWGEIGINDGNVEKTFEIKSEGTENLKLFGVTTSCMCTTAQLILDDETSPKFGMHSKSSYVLEVPPGKTAKLKVVFDPAFHGPSGVGPINRQVTVTTNDPGNPEQKYMLTAIVRN